MSKKKRSKRKLEPLLFADPNRDPNMRWFTQFDCCDPFLAFGADGKRIGLTHGLEFGRMKKESCLNVVEEWSAVTAEIFQGKKKKKKKKKKGKKVRAPGLPELVAYLQKKYDIDGFRVGRDFRAGLLEQLRDEGIHVEISDGPMFPERAIKSRSEVAKLKAANASAAAGHAAVRAALRKSTIGRNGLLKFEGKTLTAERLRHAVDVACLKTGGINNLTCIVAPGDQATDCHCVGSGPIKANELIVVDIFPKIAATGYYGDMTRTYLKGKAKRPTAWPSRPSKKA